MADETWERAAIAVYASLQTLIKTDDRLCAKRAFAAADVFVRELELRKPAPAPTQATSKDQT